MGYRIAYGEQGSVTKELARDSGKFFQYTIGFFLVFCILTATIFPEQWSVAKDLMVPGDPEVTKAAFHEMTRQLKDGEAIGDAVVTFCREVVDGAALSD